MLLISEGCADGTKGAAGARPPSYGIGRTPTPMEIAAIDIDANPAGAGLPAGQGIAAAGAVIFGQKCAMCHGPKEIGRAHV